VNGFVPEDYHRGVNHHDKVSCAQIAQAQMKESKQHIREFLHICNEDHKKNVLQKLELVTKITSSIERGEENGADTSYFCNRMNELFDSLKNIYSRKASLQAENDQIMKDANGKRKIEALYEQVGKFVKTNDNVSLPYSEMSHSNTPTPAGKESKNSSTSTLD
jgi:hypothetical protein